MGGDRARVRARVGRRPVAAGTRRRGWQRVGRVGAGAGWRVVVRRRLAVAGGCRRARAPLASRAMLVALAVLALAAALLRRWSRRYGTARTLEAVVLVGAGLLALVGLLATGMAVLGWFSSQAVVLVFAAAAVLTWPWGQVPSGEPERGPAPDGWKIWAGAAALAVLTLALRWPAIPAELGGRDQGTYVLRARHTLRTGALGLVDPVLAAAGRAQGSRPGPGDILGLYPIEAGPGRDGRYEGAYRPGFYLASRERGEVVPQFLHLHPTLLATVGLVVGPERMTAVLHFEAVLAALALWALGRRLWPRGPWSLLAAGLFVLSPIAVWVQRTPLTESLTGLLLLAAALALARGLRTGEDMTLLAALLLGATGWIRGNAWLTAPLVLALLWLSPHAGPRRRLAPAALFGLLMLSLAAHVATCYPYLFDELRRQLGALAPLSLPAVLLATGLGVGGWLLGDRLLRPLRGRVALLPGALVIAGALAVLVYAALAMRGAPPLSRLDPAGALLGALLLVAAAAGALRFAALRPVADTHAAWLLALASVPVATLALYAQRNLPQATLYYYGRYLVPELLPAACLLAAHAVAGAHAHLSARTAPRIAAGVSATLAALLLGAQAWPHVAEPVTRLQEFAGAERAIAALAAEIPEDAVVIAGGEGWHSAHTFNQIGGALALGRGRTVLPYRSQEAAYAALHELLIAGPAARERPPPRVFLLLNEATHVYRPTGADGRPQAPVAAIDDRVPAPFVARPVGLVELLVDRLTPVTGALPTRVTRADLRMGLFEVTVDAELQARVRGWRFVDGQVRGPEGLRLRRPAWVAGALCLGVDAPLVVGLPAGEGPVSLVMVSGTGGAPPEGWRVEVDGAPLDVRPAPGARTRDTLGPFALAKVPRRISVLGAKTAMDGAACPHGSLAELRVLPPDGSGFDLSPGTAWARTFAPADDLGHRTEPARWVRGRSLSRARPGTRPAATGGGLTMTLAQGRPLEFAPAYVPGDRSAEHDLVVHLRDVRVGPRARLQVWDGEELLAEVDPPDEHAGPWQAPPIAWRPAAGLAQIGLLLLDPDDEQSRLLLRDVGIFAREVEAVGELSAADG